MIYLHPSLLSSPARSRWLEHITGCRAIWLGGMRVVLRPGHGSLNLEHRPWHKPRAEHPENPL